MRKGRWRNVGMWWLWVGSFGVGWSLLASPPSRLPMWVLPVQYTQGVEGKAVPSRLLTRLLQDEVKHSSGHRLLALPPAYHALLDFNHRDTTHLNKMEAQAKEKPQQVLFVEVMRLEQEFHLSAELYHLEQGQWKRWKDVSLRKTGTPGQLPLWLRELWLTLFPPPKAGDRQTFEVKGQTFAMRYIPAGSFTMGSPQDEKERLSNEGPQRQVRLTRGFWMLETEVTQGQYKALVGENPSHFKKCGDTCPVESVSWDEARVFANTLSAQQSLSSCFTCNADGGCDIPDKAAYLACKGWRLPTEAEWEYAARAGTTGRFHTGDCITPDQANFNGNVPPEGCSKGVYREKTVAVGSFQPNAWGLYDMHGNVWEWVADWYQGTYDSNDLGDPLQLLGSDPSKRSDRVIRGGSWYSIGGRLRSAFRGNGRPADRGNFVGFRLSRSL